MKLLPYIFAAFFCVSVNENAEAFGAKLTFEKVEMGVGSNDDTVDQRADPYLKYTLNGSDAPYYTQTIVDCNICIFDHTIPFALNFDDGVGAYTFYVDIWDSDLIFDDLLHTLSLTFTTTGYGAGSHVIEFTTSGDARARFYYRVDFMGDLGDLDRDAIPDTYEVNNGLTRSSNDSWLDTDLDGVSNLQEYHDGTDPLDPASRTLP